MLVPWVGMTEIEQQTSKKNTREKQYVRLRTRTVISTRIQNCYVTTQASWTFFSDKEGQEKSRTMANDCDGRSQQNKPAERRRSDRPSKDNIKVKNITLNF